MHSSKKNIWIKRFLILMVALWILGGIYMLLDLTFDLNWFGDDTDRWYYEDLESVTRNCNRGRFSVT